MPKDVLLTHEEFQCMQIFSDITGASPIDCIIDDKFNRVIALVRPEEVGKAIGRRGAKIKTLKELLKKDVEVVPFSENLEECIKNIFMPAKVESVKVNRTGKVKTVYVRIAEADKGIAIGKNGRNVHKARLILKRHFDIDNLVVV
ncbi:transcription elongation factor NusA [Ignicoccus islandicus DSM 13165]|uniref:Probable transcription termination protein NusA n=1 Tax=Ignicoccus islandicus DSM 13165 TaxID=940295 RepID=A0A0U2VD53_9CREN|nr:NusA-like transcription termination signal-binding factor [Ignicoccus islandicus]ALU12002.1 transcription elongation factor NusA [Ignicoccus islandicus DSM 13165]